ncbi:hypothetical protein BV133_998 [Blastochloris viridis]|uniref:Pathogenicity locus n=1 Tax=Blastochloris viridis TaxID=1079 RepID=A0A0H5BE12_BLAVI|nr:hypothetical protein BV133_998 [Blastochloris viridis]CUU44065.1 Pathogenicity locus [Blastochloris viridis]
MVLPLTAAERAALRRARLVTADLAGMAAEEVAALAQLPLPRCRALCALAQFQRLDSVGPSIAADLVGLGLTSLDQLAKADPLRLYRELEQAVGRRVDPCVEDVFRCAVAQARDPALPEAARNWWYWMRYRGTAVVAPPAR